MNVIYVELSLGVTAKIEIWVCPVGNKEELDKLNLDVCIALKIKEYEITFLAREYPNKAVSINSYGFSLIQSAIENFVFPEMTLEEWYA